MAGVTTKTLAGSGFVRAPGLQIARTIDATAVDTGNTGQTHILRAGLVLGKLTSGGNLVHYLDSASDGSQVAHAILAADVDLKDGDPAGTAAAHKATVYVAGWFKSSALFGYDAAALADFVTGARIWID